MPYLFDLAAAPQAGTVSNFTAGFLRRHAAWVFGLIVVPVFGLPLLFSPDSGTHPDEATYLAVSLEMFRGGDWLVPRLEGAPVFFKPPLLYWLHCAAFAVFGESLAAARAISLLATAGIGVVAAHASKQTTSALQKCATIGVVMASVVALKFGTLAMMDPLFVLCLSSATLFAQQHRRWSLVAAAACVALATLLKGPIGVLLGAVLVVTALVLSRRRPSAAAVIAALVVFTALVLPWFVAMALRFGDEFWSKFLVREHLGKLQHVDLLVSPLHNALLAFVALLPWSLLAWRGTHGKSLFVGAAIVVIGAYSIQASRQLHYFLPLVPFVAPLIASQSPSASPRVMTLFGIVLAAIVAGAGVLLVRHAAWLAAASGLLVCVAGAASIARWPNLATLTAFTFLTWSWVLGVFVTTVLPPSWPAELGRRFSGTPIALSRQDVGVARLATGLDLHRVETPITPSSQYRVWADRTGACAEVHGRVLAQWNRLGERAPPSAVFSAIRNLSLDGLMEDWCLCEVPP